MKIIDPATGNLFYWAKVLAFGVVAGCVAVILVVSLLAK